jgi:XTP/dITP diphosphohydrolase
VSAVPGAGSARLVLATHNPHKVTELRDILRAVPELASLDPAVIVGAGDVGAPEPVEDGVTFEANALIKARSLVAFTGLPAVADDSGVAVDVLGGAPGVFSARWSGRHGDDDANLDLLLAQLSDVPDAHRGGRFVCAAALVTPDGREIVRVGEMRGSLLRARRGAGGFGYDPIFVPDGETRTTSELTAQEKNAVSHRGIAFRALAPEVASVLSGR